MSDDLPEDVLAEMQAGPEPDEHPNDTEAQAILRVRVERMMEAGRSRNVEGERVAKLVAAEVERRVEALLREPLSEHAVLVLMEDGDVRWEEA